MRESHHSLQKGKALIALAESAGENAQDLCAAAWVAKQLCPKEFGDIGFFLMDDQRDPALASEVARALCANPSNLVGVVGHFSSPVAKTVAPIYRSHNLAFIASGSSADDLCTKEASGAAQLFAQDAPQLECIADAIMETSGAVLAMGQLRNAGEHLCRALKGVLRQRGRSQDVTTKLIDFDKVPVQIPDGDFGCCVFLGSKEFTAKCLNALRPSQSETVILSDDSLNAPSISQYATQVSTPIFCAALDTSAFEGNIETIDQATRLAEGLLKRKPGPYFLTSLIALAILAQCEAERASTRSSRLKKFKDRRFRTPFGNAHFDSLGRAVGLGWKLQRVL